MLRCESLVVTYGDMQALDGVSLDVVAGSITAVMGESGSGKTTLLRAISGLAAPESGRVIWQGRDVTEVPPHMRGFGLMFQEYALFPHLDVAGNIAFGLRMQNREPPETRRRVSAMLDLVGLEGYGDRQVSELSGGEQQRVALARTLAPQPSLVLLDEPLGALDRARRDQLLSDMQRIFSDLGVTAIYVTHDHHEAFAIAEIVAVLDAGDVVAHGTPGDLWRQPGHVAVATLLGFPVLRDVVVSNGTARIGGAPVAVSLADGRHHLAFTTGAVTIDEAGAVEVIVQARRFGEGEVTAVIQLDGVEMVAAATATVEVRPARARIDSARLAAVSD